jgi:uncharacterized protein
MSESASPRAVFERLLDDITHRRWADVPSLYADDAVVEQPFDRPAPRRLESREQISAHFAGATSMPLELDITNLLIHQTQDPEVVVGEFDYTGRVTTSGHTFTVGNIIVMRVRDGKIVSSRDYHNHVAIAEALAAPSEATSAARTAAS